MVCWIAIRRFETLEGGHGKKRMSLASLSCFALQMMLQGVRCAVFFCGLLASFGARGVLVEC